MIPDFKVKVGRLTLYSTERFYPGWVGHIGYIQRRGKLWHHYVFHYRDGHRCKQVKVLGFILTWWAVNRFKDIRPTAWERLISD